MNRQTDTAFTAALLQGQMCGVQDSTPVYSQHLRHSRKPAETTLSFQVPSGGNKAEAVTQLSITSRYWWNNQSVPSVSLGQILTRWRSIRKEEEQQKEQRNQYQEYNENAGDFLNEYMTQLIS